MFKFKTPLNACSLGLNFPNHLVKGKRSGLSPSLVAPQIVLKDLSNNKWVDFQLAANQKLLRNLLHFLSSSNLAAIVSILAETVYTNCT